MLKIWSCRREEGIWLKFHIPASDHIITTIFTTFLLYLYLASNSARALTKFNIQEVRKKLEKMI